MSLNEVNPNGEQKLKSIRKIISWLVVLLWMGVIFFLSAQSSLPDLTGGLPDLQDILGHFVAYAGLAFLLTNALTQTGGVKRPFLWALALTVLYGFTDEFHQGFVPHRHPDLFDILVDTTGAIFALAVAQLWQKRRLKPTR